MNAPFEKRRKWQKLTLITLAVVVTAVALFYLEEDWRGKRAWEKCKTELAAKGIELDWNKLIPPAVPDDQNFFMASTNILIRFKKAQTEAEGEAARKSSWLKTDFNFPTFNNSRTNPLTIATITVLPPESAKAHHGPADQVVMLGASQTSAQIETALRKTLGRSVLGVAGFNFSECQLSNLAPSQIWLGSDTTPGIADLAKLVPESFDKNLGRLQVAATDDPQKFNVWLIDAKVTSVADYLKWSDQFGPAFDELREALKRPAAVLPGDYAEPYLTPIPNFVTMRAVAQILAQRAQCRLLLHDPDSALHDLTLVHDLCRILEKPPTGQPETLVEAMINVAITGLYVDIIAKGFRVGEWQKPQLIALQEQLKTISLPQWVAEAFRKELTADAQTFENTPADKITGIITSGSFNVKPRSLWSRLKDPLYLFLEFAPRGWIRLNLVSLASLKPMPSDFFDLEHGLVYPRNFDRATTIASQSLNRKSPFKILAAVAVPNYSKAVQVTSANQTLVNQAQIACALERYRLTNGEYPEALDALVPAFIEQLPHDLIGGQPLHYRRTDDGKFLLYSVGWNETDDGGKNKEMSGDLTHGDWVWPN